MLLYLCSRSQIPDADGLDIVGCVPIDQEASLSNQILSVADRCIVIEKRSRKAKYTNLESMCTEDVTVTCRECTSLAEIMSTDDK